jgi:hypothetical protein
MLRADDVGSFVLLLMQSDLRCVTAHSSRCRQQPAQSSQMVRGASLRVSSPAYTALKVPDKATMLALCVMQTESASTLRRQQATCS